MPVFQGSRYAKVSVTVLRDANNRVIRYLHTRTPTVLYDLATPSTVHAIRDGDDLDRLAFLQSGRERKWHLIADVSDIFWPFDLEPGTEIVVPSASEFQRRT